MSPFLPPSVFVFRGSWRRKGLSNKFAMRASYHGTHERVMSHMWTTHVTHVNESCHTYERVMSHMWTSHDTHVNESCHTYERVVSHTWPSHITQVNESCHTCECVMRPMKVWESACQAAPSLRKVARNTIQYAFEPPEEGRGSPTNCNSDRSCDHYKPLNESWLNESCHIYDSAMSHMWMSHATHKSGGVLASCDTYTSVRSHIWMSHVTHMNQSGHACEWVMSHIWMSHVTHINQSSHTCERVILHMNESFHTYEWFISHIWMNHVTYMNES